MLEKKLLLENKLGLHTRAASKLVNTANRYTSKINIQYEGRQVDSKSIMKVLTLGAPNGAEVTVTVDGADEAKAMESMIALIQENFGELE
jgi:phosphocarrier protein HPr